MALGKWSGSVWMAVCLIAMADAFNDDSNDTTTVGLRQENPLKGPENSFTDLDSNPNFTCVSPSRDCVGMNWYKYSLERHQVPIYSVESGIYPNSKYSVENTTVGCRLIVRSVGINDTGSFICQIHDQIAYEGTAYLFVIHRDTPQGSPLKGPDNSIRVVGSDATFTCVSPSRDCVGMVWYKYLPGKSQVTIYSEPNGVRLRDKYIVENSTVGCKLTVRNVSVEDFGYFICQITVASNTREGTGFLYVISTQGDNPLKGPRNSLIDFGSNATFTCFSPSRDCAGMTWYKQIPGRDRETIFSEEDGIYLSDKYIVENFNGKCNLIVTNVAVEDNGLVICEILVSRMNFEETARLIVTGLKGPENSFSNLESDANFTCVSPSRDCVGMIWYKYTLDKRNLVPIYNEERGIYPINKYSVENTTVGCELIVRAVGIKDTGYFICQIREPVVCEEGAYLFVNHEDTPQGSPLLFRVLGSDATFTCISPTRDCVGMVWYKRLLNTRREEIIYSAPVGVRRRDIYTVENSTEGCHLTIREVQAEDFGYFICEITIPGSRPTPTVRGTGFLYVIKTLDQNEDTPLKGPRNSLTDFGSNATFTCFSPSRDCAGITWYKQLPGRNRDIIFCDQHGIYLRDKYIVENVNGKCNLIVTNVDWRDIGSFICKILVSRMNFEGTARLTVTDPRENLPKGPKNSFSVVGSNATFTCVSFSRDCDGMTWYRSILGGNRVPIFSARDGINTTDKYIVKNSTLGCELTVRNVQMQDAGYVVCEILHMSRILDRRTFLFVINKQRESQLMGPENSFRAIGSNATSRCISASRDCVGMAWMRVNGDGNRETIYTSERGLILRDKYSVENSTLGCKLIVQNVEMEDAKPYSCQIAIGNRSLEGTANLIVIDGSLKGNPLSGPTDSWESAGSNVTFTCLSPSGNCYGMTWYIRIPGRDRESIFRSYIKNKYIVENSDGVCNLIVTNVQLNDTGSVICEISLWRMTFEGTAHLTVINLRQDPPNGPENSFSVVGSNAIFTCLSSTRDCDGMTWYRSILGGNRVTIFSLRNGIDPMDKYIVKSSSVGCLLIVTNVQMQDAGYVVCEFLHRSRYLERKAFLFVTNTQRESQLMGPENSFRAIGSNATFTCVSQSRDCVGMAWMRVNGVENIETIYTSELGLILRDKYSVENSTLGCKLIVKNVEMEDAKPYSCQIAIGNRSLEGTAYLIAIDGSSEGNPLNGPTESLKSVGSYAVFSCYTPSKDCGGMTWYKYTPGTDRVTIFNDDESIYLRDKYIVVNFNGICHLMVTNIELNDTGSFICQILISRITFEGTANLTVISDDATLKMKRQGTLQLGEELSALDPPTELIGAVKERDNPSSVIEKPEKKLYTKNENFNEID